MVHDLCRETGKEVDWRHRRQHRNRSQGARSVKDPLIHLRNATTTDGIAGGAWRPRGDADACGCGLRQRGRISVEVGDDGRALLLDALRDAAVRSRLTSAEHTRDERQSSELRVCRRRQHEPGHHDHLDTASSRSCGNESRADLNAVDTGAGTVIRLDFPPASPIRSAGRGRWASHAAPCRPSSTFGIRATASQRRWNAAPSPKANGHCRSATRATFESRIPPR